MFHHYKKEINEKQVKEQYSETIVTLRLPKKYYKTAYAVANLLGHDPLMSMLAMPSYKICGWK